MSDQRVQGKLAYDWMVTLLEEKHFLKVEKNKKKNNFQQKEVKVGDGEKLHFCLEKIQSFPVFYLIFGELFCLFVLFLWLLITTFCSQSVVCFLS